MAIQGQSFLSKSAFAATPPAAQVALSGFNGANGAGITCMNVVLDATLALSPVHISNLIITGVGTSGAASKGLIFNPAGDVVLENVEVSNFDSCLSFVTTGTAGITAMISNPILYQCKTHFLTFDGWPEAWIKGGRFGSQGDGTAIQDMVYFTKTGVVGGGGGPNTIDFWGTNFVTGGKADCFIRWGGMTGSGGVVGEFRFTDIHMEQHRQGTAEFCSDATVPLLDGVFITNMLDTTFDTTETSSKFLPVLGLDPKTAMKGWHFNGNTFNNCATSGLNMFNMAPAPLSGTALQNVHLTGNYFCAGPTFSSNGVGFNSVISTGNIYGNLVITGNWYSFVSSGDEITGGTDTATGKVSISSAYRVPWTPAVSFATTPGTVTYSYQVGNFYRTGDGGYTIDFAMALASITGASGNAFIQTPVLHQCEPITVGSATASGGLNYISNLTGLWAPPRLVWQPQRCLQYSFISPGRPGSTPSRLLTLPTPPFWLARFIAQRCIR